MHIFAFSRPRSRHEDHLLKSHHELRARVFSERLGWDVAVVDGREVDVFDTYDPTYILAVSSTGQVAGCARLLPANGPTMVGDVFSSLLPTGHLQTHFNMIESSRFCVDTTLDEGRGEGSVHEATLTMFAGILEWSITNGITEIVTVTDLRFERILARVGWPLRRLGEPKQIGVTKAVAGTLSADAATFAKLRPANYSSTIASRADRRGDPHQAGKSSMLP